MFWWLRYRSLLKYFEYSKDKDSKKQKILYKNELLVDAEISKLSNDTLLDYLFNEKLFTPFRDRIIDKINSSPLGVKKELLLLVEQRNYTLGELENYYKICGNCVIIEELIRNKTSKEIDKLLKRKNSDIIKSLDNEDIPFLYKRLLIDSFKNDKEVICKMLNSVKNNKVIDYIIYGNKYNSRVVSHILFSINICDDIKEKIIKYHIDSTNIIDILSSVLVTNLDIRNKIITLKNSELIQNIKELSLLQIQNLFYQSHCVDLIELIYEIRYEDIIKIINELDNSKLLIFISRCNYEKVVELCYKLRHNDISNSIKETNKLCYIEILLSKNISLKIKNQILNTHKKEILELISTLKKYQVLEILDSENTLDELKEMVFLNSSELINSIIFDLNIYEIMKFYFSKSMYPKMKELILELAINSKNIFVILNRNYHFCISPECKMIMDYKNTILRSYLKKLNIRQLVIFKTEPELPMEFRNYILENNIDIVREKINQDKNECFILAVDLMEVPSIIKKILLDGTNIKTEDVDIVFTLGKYCRNSNILEYYNKIQDFIESLGIEFKLFIQYGAGSKKYNKWYDELISIIENHKEKEFRKVSNYLFRYYYISAEDNDVDAIKNFLEILNNFDKYNELFKYIIDNNYILTYEDKVNLQFIFNEDINIEIKTPCDLVKAKDELYRKYLRKINRSDITLEDIRNIYNNMLFCGADIEFDKIGNKIGLYVLREKNINSKVIVNYIDSLLKYIEFIELVNDSTNMGRLKDSLRYLLETNIEEFIRLKNEFSNINVKIKRLFELDSQINLTNVEKASKMKDVIRKDLESKYGLVLDFSDKNYILYAHVLSPNEDVINIINGVSSGKRNFISLSPISYLGQKYYYGYGTNVTFAYDKVKDGSFICSSRENLGSNNLIKANSSEVKFSKKYQEGILDTSSASKNNPEALFYREGLKPCGIILPGGREPNKVEIELHEKYNLPFIITQLIGKSIENVKNMFGQNNEYYDFISSNEILNKMYDKVKLHVSKVDESEYTGREIAVLTDSHAMYEPTLEILLDIRKRGISEIYSLGDNIGLGPNPNEVLDMLESYNVKSICGNSEYYNTLGISPFSSYFNTEKIENQLWTEEQLSTRKIERMKLWTPSLDIKIGNQNVGLCHFANDIRWDFNKQNTWTYQERFIEGINSKQFLYTNSDKAKKDLEYLKETLSKESAKGVIDAIKHPIFDGKKVTDYDTILQGHVHFDMKDHIDNTSIYTLRAAGMGYKSDSKDTACYYILKERKDGNFDIERKLIRFDRHKLLLNVTSSTLPHKEYLLKMIK